MFKDPNFLIKFFFVLKRKNRNFYLNSKNTYMKTWKDLDILKFFKITKKRGLRSFVLKKKQKFTYIFMLLRCLLFLKFILRTKSFFYIVKIVNPSFKFY